MPEEVKKLEEQTKTEEVKKPEEPKKPEEGKKPVEAKKPQQPTGKPTNCIKCNKRLKRKSCYYRNGGYYCSKGCWEQAVTEAKKKEKEK
jgi:hypothetical protein